MVYSFTSKPIRDALLRAKARGVTVRIISDRINLSGRGSVVPDLQAEGIEVTYDFEHAIQHNKVAIIGRSWVATGSFNWTDAAEHRNAENLEITLDPEKAQAYLEDWQAIRATAVER